MSLAPGDHVVWWYTQPGYYGFRQPVPARVVKVLRARVRIVVLLKDRTWALRTVGAPALQPRDWRVPEDLLAPVGQ